MWDIIRSETVKTNVKTIFNIILHKDDEKINHPNHILKAINKFYIYVTDDLNLNSDENKALFLFCFVAREI